MKNVRQQKILELIEKYDIDTQDTLQSKLREEGLFVTQTTISRDIRQLNLIKGVAANGTYKYVSPNGQKGASPVISSSITDSITQIDFACNIVVVKTFSGMANAIAVCIESLQFDNIVGSVAGDDTILIVMKSAELAEELSLILKNKFGKD